MINVNVEFGSITRIEAQAAKAFADGEPESACPYSFGSMSGRIWLKAYYECKSVIRRSGAPKASREGA
jgi:hypothetical protein